MEKPLEICMPFTPQNVADLLEILDIIQYDKHFNEKGDI
jgi:hypothetical protein